MYKLFLAWRYLLSRKIIFFAIASVAVGVIVLIVVTSVMGGFVRDVQLRIKGISSDMSVSISDRWRSSSHFFDDYHKNYQLLIEEIQSITHVVACAPRIEWGAMLSTNDNLSVPVQIVGIDPRAEDKVSKFGEYLITKETPNFLISGQSSSNPGVIIGVYVGVVETDKGRLRPVMWEIGQPIALTTVILRDALFQTRQQEFIIADQYNSGFFEHDNIIIYIPLKVMQDFLNVSDITKINIALDDYQYAEQVRVQIEGILGKSSRYFRVKTWEDEKRQFLTAVAVEKNINAVLLFFVIIVAGFNIAAMLTMRVVEKTKDIGIIRALGGTPKGIMALFLYQGLLISLIGCLIGVISGCLIATNLNPIEAVLTKLFGFKLFPPNIYKLDKIPSDIDIPVIIIITIATMVCCIFFSIYPAVRASRFEPAEALRYE